MCHLMRAQPELVSLELGDYVTACVVKAFLQTRQERGQSAYSCLAQVCGVDYAEVQQVVAQQPQGQIFGDLDPSLPPREQYFSWEITRQ